MLRLPLSRLLAPLLVLALALPVPAVAQAIQETRMRVQVMGAVRHPGVYTVLIGSRVADVLAKAGGPRPDADLKELNLTRVMTDGDQCQVLSKRETAALVPAPATSNHPGKARGKGRAPGGKRGPKTGPKSAKTRKGMTVHVDKGGGGPRVHLNSASVEQLEQLPGVGPGLASAILRQRQRQGRFHAVDELLEVAGLGQKRLERIRPFVVVD